MGVNGGKAFNPGDSTWCLKFTDCHFGPPRFDVFDADVEAKGVPLLRRRAHRNQTAQECADNKQPG
ncbi:hypothetical protein [Paraburkholderia aromaticivorans]|uniref:hypothetical protein n=1 Tax=Paraburkholderia aromaticivorans TaxID=2026199 RepID=UPI001455E399|nr:hypothetical protein [Paraburkholderia aromaticivorans]